MLKRKQQKCNKQESINNKQGINIMTNKYNFHYQGKAPLSFGEGLGVRLQ